MSADPNAQRAVVIALLVVQQGVCCPKDAVVKALDLLGLPGEMLLPCLMRLDTQRHGNAETTRSLVVAGIWEWICGEAHSAEAHWLWVTGRILGQLEVERSACSGAWSMERAEEIYEAWLHGLPSLCSALYEEAA